MSPIVKFPILTLPKYLEEILDSSGGRAVWQGRTDLANWAIRRNFLSEYEMDR
jgi:hypothetical protein